MYLNKIPSDPLVLPWNNSNVLTAKLKYRFDDNTRNGELIESNTNILMFYDADKKSVLYENFDCTVKDHWNIIEHDFYNSLYTTVEFKYTPREYKRIIRNLVEGIVELHNKNKNCLSLNSVKNLVIKNGIVNFYKFKFRPVTKNGRRDLKNLENVIRKDIYHGYDCPRILNSFLDTLKKVNRLLYLSFRNKIKFVPWAFYAIKI
ncbi:beta-adrenergic receptor kinase 1 [Striga asiatica]|uniref:Beta-adrenergic receptor kinase 1 n=1 Tax=Striga asiatica TaxID=4170 RepID=A0A5A7Q039_STRAF|nr:beta-adrenergic receptor kinase 1 [Striga asiatica]